MKWRDVLDLMIAALEKEFVWIFMRIADLRRQEVQPLLKTISVEEIFNGFAVSSMGTTDKPDIVQFGDKGDHLSLHAILNRFSYPRCNLLRVNSEEQAAAEFGNEAQLGGIIR